jgi:predicted O-methyltransferase YrrM
MILNDVRNLLLRRKDTSWHIPFVASLAQILSPAMYVEIGIYEASTLNAVAKHCGKAIGVDINPTAGKFIKARNAEFLNGTVSDLIELCKLRAMKIDFAFIDADHRSEAVMTDFHGIQPFLSQNALVLFHDTWPETIDYASDDRCSDSYRVPELLSEHSNNEWKSITIPIFPGLTIASRSNLLPEWLRQQTLDSH